MSAREHLAKAQGALDEHHGNPKPVERGLMIAEAGAHALVAIAESAVSVADSLKKLAR